MVLYRSLSDGMRADVSAQGFLYKLCGSSQPAILLGDDGHSYVVKFHGFPCHQALVNEAVGSSLIQRFGLPAPAWTSIFLSGEFIDQNPGLWFHSGNRSIKPLSGLHFASRIIETDGDQRTYQVIPHSWIDRVQNRSDFLAVLVLDLWANNCDRRQAVFLSNSDHSRLFASFIDNDSMFGGKFGSELTFPRRPMFYDLDLYRGIWDNKTVQHWLKIIDGINEQAIRRMVDNVPKEWAAPRLRLDIVEQLEKRRILLPRLLRGAEEVLSTGYSLKINRARYATEPNPYHSTRVHAAIQP